MTHRSVIRRGRTPLVAAAVALVALMGSALAAGAGTAGTAGSAARWTRISGPGNDGIQLGLARTRDGVLDVIWNRGNPAPTTIFDTRYSPSGAKLGTTTVAKNFGGAEGLALLVMPDGTLRLFAIGSPTTGSPVSGVNTFTSAGGGTGWKLDQGVVWSGSGSNLGATLTKDGEPVTAYSGVFHKGLGSGTPTTVCSCFSVTSDVATDAGSGAVVMAGIGQPAGQKEAGTFVEQALPSVGGRVLLPSANIGPGGYGISGRIGAAGVYVMYTDDLRPQVTKPAVRLYRYHGPTRVIARGPYTFAKAFAGPAGRLWLAWGDAKDGVFVTRTNKAAGRLEPVQKLKAPAGTQYAWNAQGEGSVGPLDLFVDADNGKGHGFWHTHVLPRLTVQTHVSRSSSRSTATISVTDAGDPVAGAVVVVGGKHLKTPASGRVVLTLRPGSYPVRVGAPGFAAATTRIKA